MKKLKLMSSIAALVLVLSVGACDQAEDDSDAVSSGDTASETVTLSNYTVSIGFIDADGSAVAIPEYGTAYIIGSWDGWSEFISLTENNGTYTHTFSSIDEGTYGYKVVEWYTDEKVSWDDCVEITTTDQTLTVKAEDGDNHTQSITHTLASVLAAPMTDDEIIDAILGAAAAVDDSAAEEIGWNAYHFESVEDEETDTYDMTTKDGYTYGLWVNVDDEDETTIRYIKGGYQFVYNPDEEDEEDQYTKVNWSEAFTYPLEEWIPCEPLERVDSFGNEEEPLNLDDFDKVTLTKGVADYTLVLEESATVEDDPESMVYTFVTDLSFNLIGLEYYEDYNGEITSRSAKEVSAADVEATMTDFDYANWGYDGSSLGEFLAAAAESGSYYMEIEYLIYQSKFYQEIPSSVSLSNVFDYVCRVYATSDTLLIEYGYYMTIARQTYFMMMDVEIYHNATDEQENDVTEIYYIGSYETSGNAYSGYTYTYYFELDDTLEGNWQDNEWSLADLDASDFAFDSVTRTTVYGDQEEYSVASSASNALFGASVCPNFSWLCYGYGFDYYLGGSDLSYIAYYPTLETLEIGYDDGGYWYYTSSYLYTEDGDAAYDPETGEYLTIDGYIAQEVLTYTDISEVGSTVIPTSCANDYYNENYVLPWTVEGSPA